MVDLFVVFKVIYGLKYVEFIMFFYIDLGFFMLGDVFSIMDKEEWDFEEEEGGYYGDEGVIGIII